DLFYRLEGISIRIPPLRQRRGEIAVLATHFAEQGSQRQGKPMVGIDQEAMALLLAYRWPGNIREPRNVMERAVLLSDGQINAAHLPAEKLGRLWHADSIAAHPTPPPEDGMPSHGART